MAEITAFKALRPQPQFAKQVASRPYDVLSSAEARIETQGNPNSFLHITKSEIDLPENIDPHSAAVYEKAKENLRGFIQRNILFREERPCYYIYRLVMNGQGQTGLVCCSSIEDYENNIIKKHEFTRPEKELDRINHIQVTGAQTGNVFIAYRSVPEINDVIEKWKQTHTPVYDFTAEDQVMHSVWIISDTNVVNRITDLFKNNVPFTYIADGHHRAASAAKVKSALGKKATEEADYFLTTLFPSDQLRIMEYNRAVRDLNGLSIHDFLQRVDETFDIEKLNGSFSQPESHEFGLYIQKQWYKLRSKEGTFDHDPVGTLDVTILQNNLLDRVLGIKDPRTDKRVDFIGGIRGLKELEKKVNSGEMAAAFCLHPVSIQQLFDIADSGNVMPPKSTWFEPKLRDGLLTHLIY